MELFHHSASLGDKSSHIPEYVAKKIVTRCQGFPIALRVIGESLSGKPKAVWEAKLTEWSRGSSSIVSEKELLPRLKSSIDELKKDMPIPVECFLDFGLFPQNKYIPVATLFDMWTELYDLRNDNERIAKLYQLSSRSLVDLVDGREVQMDANGYYSQHYVIQHGLLRELAMYISNEFEVEERRRLIIEIFGENDPKWIWKQKCQTMKARLLSISTGDEKFLMKWPTIHLPEAEVLVLFFQTQEYVLPEFVDKMPELKVLVITCDSSYVLAGAALSGFQPLNQLSNLKTIILEGISIPSITRNPIVLKSVKKISLSRCYEVSEAFSDPVEISKLFPELEVMNVDFCNLVELPADLGNLTLLKELNITNCCGVSTLPEVMENLVNLEVLRLRFCRDFSKIPHSINLLQRLKSLDLAYCPSIMKLPKNIGELSNLRKLDTRNCSGLKELPRSTSDLKHLEVVICTSKTKMLTEALPHGKNIRMEAPTLGWEDFY